MSSSGLSSLSSPPSSDGEPPPKTLKLKQTSLSFAPKRQSTPSSPEPVQREPSPPHEYVLADNEHIAFIVMFRARFAEAFPKSVSNLGPQDIERGVVDTIPSTQIENLLCALLGLVLNRKKYPEREHYGRPLEEALSTMRVQWPREWNGVNPIHGGKTFRAMNPTERLDLLRVLVLWSLNSSEAISAIIKESYKQARQEGDLNQPLAVQPWGDDGRKRRYWLIEGQNDTSFRIYRESNPKNIKRTWWSVASTIDEAKELADSLEAEKSQAGKRLGGRILSAIPRFEATEEKRKRKEYRVHRREQFSRPPLGMSLYEGRTRGKRMKYTFSDDEDSASDATSNRRSRNSGISTPAEAGIPTVTASGRQVRSRFGRSYGEPMADVINGGSVDNEQYNDIDELGLRDRTRGRRSGRSTAFSRQAHRNSADDSDAEDEAVSSAEEWDGDDEDVEGKFDDEDEDDAVSDAESADSLLDKKQSLIIKLPYRKPATAFDSVSDPANKIERDSDAIHVAQEPKPVQTEYQPPSKMPFDPTRDADTIDPEPQQDPLQTAQQSHRESNPRSIHIETSLAPSNEHLSSINDLKPQLSPHQNITAPQHQSLPYGLQPHGSDIGNNAPLIHQNNLPPSAPLLANPTAAYTHQPNGYPPSGTYPAQQNVTQPPPPFAYSPPKWTDPPPQPPPNPYAAPPTAQGWR